MGTPNKHAELIKAWADGAEIEARKKGKNEWGFVQNPTWSPDCEYRIKPEVKQPVVRWLWAHWSAAHKAWLVSKSMLSEKEAREMCPTMTKIEATRTEFTE